MKTNLLITFIICLVNLSSFGQSPGRVADNGRIHGTVLDAETNTPVEFATIALHDASGKVINGTVADDKGKFSITKIADGTYSVVISFIGYETQTVSGLTIAGKDNEIDLGIIKLSTGSKVLSEVVVEGKKELIEERVDRTIYNAEQDATTKGGDATDVLKRVPLLSVDLDGNVSLRGSSNIQVLINGKPSTIMASSVADALKQISADQIKSVEVITSPSAKYDAEGSGGIINIITKKNTLEGLTLGIDAGIGYRGSNLGLNGNYRKKKMGFSLGGWGRANYNVNGQFQNDQTFIESNRRTFQEGDNESNGLFGNYSLGWDYDINKNNFLTASVRYGVRNNNNYQDKLRSLTFENDVITQETLSDNNTLGESGTVDANFTYTHLFKKPQQELSLLTSYSRNDRVNDFLTTYFDPTNGSIIRNGKNDNDGVDTEYTFQLDYQTPISTNQMFETGLKQIRRNVTSDFVSSVDEDADGIYETVTSNNDQLNYSQDVSAAYGSYTFSAANGISLKGGLRYEYTSINAYTVEDGDIEIPEYDVFVPSINASKKLKNGTTVKASYNKRIQRPSIRYLNPNEQPSNNLLNVTVGNPQLDPEYTDNYELGYSTFVKGVSLNFTGFFRNSTNAIQSLRKPADDGTNVIFTTYDNIGKEQSVGSSVFANITLGKFNLSGGGDVYYMMLDNNVPDPDDRASNEGFVYMGRMFGGYSFEKGWGLQFFGFYRGKRVQLQGEQGGFRFYTLSVRKDFKNKRGSYGIGIENFLSKSITIRNETITNDINQRSFTTMNNIGFRFNISYRIGKMSFDNQPRRRRSINNDDLKDGGDGGDGGMGMSQGAGSTGGQRGGGVMPAGGGRPAVAAAPIAAANPDAVVKAEGKWAYTLQSPQGGTGTITITKEGDVYSGIINSSRMPKDIPLTTVSVKGDELTLTYDVAFGGNTTTIQVKAIISGDDMSGNMTLGQFGTFPITAKRGE